MSHYPDHESASDQTEQLRVSTCHSDYHLRVSSKSTPFVQHALHTCHKGLFHHPFRKPRMFISLELCSIVCSNYSRPQRISSGSRLNQYKLLHPAQPVQLHRFLKRSRSSLLWQYGLGADCDDRVLDGPALGIKGLQGYESARMFSG